MVPSNLLQSTRFNTPIDPAIVAEYNQTWDASVYGTDGPIQVTFPPWVWPTSSTFRFSTVSYSSDRPSPGIQFQAWNEVGVPTQFEGAAGKSYNAFWVPSNADADVRRSYARNQYLDPAKARTNLELLTSYRVNEVLFSSTRREERRTVRRHLLSRQIRRLFSALDGCIPLIFCRGAGSVLRLC